MGRWHRQHKHTAGSGYLGVMLYSLYLLFIQSNKKRLSNKSSIRGDSNNYMLARLSRVSSCCKHCIRSRFAKDEEKGAATHGLRSRWSRYTSIHEASHSSSSHFQLFSTNHAVYLRSRFQRNGVHALSAHHLHACQTGPMVLERSPRFVVKSHAGLALIFFNNKE